MDGILNQITTAVVEYAPRILGALAVFGIGWLIALAISAGVRKLLRRTSIDDRLSGWLNPDQERDRIDTAAPVAKGVFFLLMLLVIVATFQILGLTIITEPLNALTNQVFAYAPKLLGGLVLLVVALLVATVIRIVLGKLLATARVDGKFGGQSGERAEQQVPVSKTIAEAAYWLVLLLFLPAVLGALGLAGLLGPVQHLTDKILGFLPHLLAAALIFVVGWFVARIVQRIVTNLLALAGADRLSERIGLASALGSQPLSKVLGMVLYAFILIPVLISALNALELEAVTAPASQMLDVILGALPNIFAAGVIIFISYLIGRFIAGLVTNLLAGIGLDRLPNRLGLVKDGGTMSPTMSQILGRIVLAVIMLFAVAESANLLGFSHLAVLTSRFLVFAGQALMGLVILGIGLFLANLVAGLVRGASRFMSSVVRVAILILASAMALSHMGLASEIINLAFGLLLGAVAVAAAIAFGLGGREVAARQLADWRGSLAGNEAGEAKERQARL